MSVNTTEYQKYNIHNILHVINKNLTTNRKIYRPSVKYVCWLAEVGVYDKCIGVEIQYLLE